MQLPTTYPTCRGTARNPDATAEIDNDGTCPACRNPAHPWFAALQGRVEAPYAVLADPIIQARRSYPSDEPVVTGRL